MNYSNLFNLSGKTAIVTGGAGILGTHFCKGLSDNGANVVVADNNIKMAEEVAHKIGTRSIAIEVELTDEDSVEKLIDKTINHFGDIQILHNNAASKSKDLKMFFEPADKFDMNIWDEIMKVNVNGLFLATRQAAKFMMAQGKGGSIIQTSSIYGILGPDQRIYDGSKYLDHQISTPPVYSASKGAVVSLTKYAATYWAKYKIRVNCLVPGGVKSGQNKKFNENYSKRIPLGRMANPSEMVGPLVFLASDASSYITGQNIIVDGGLQAW